MTAGVVFWKDPKLEEQSNIRERAETSKAAPFAAGRGGAFSSQDGQKRSQEPLKLPEPKTLKGPDRTINSGCRMDEPLFYQRTSLNLTQCVSVCVWGGVPRSMLFDFRVLMISSWEASPNCLVRFSDMLCRPKPSLRNAGSGLFWSGLRELRGQTGRSGNFQGNRSNTGSLRQFGSTHSSF